MSVRNFHSQNCNTDSLARHCCLQSLSDLARKCTKAHISSLIKVEDIIILYILRDHESVSLCHRSDIQKGVEIIISRHFI